MNEQIENSLAKIETGISDNAAKLKELDGGFAAVKGLPETFKELKSDVDKIRDTQDAERRERASAPKVRTLRHGEVVSEACARFIAAIAIKQAFMADKLTGINGDRLVDEAGKAFNIGGGNISTKAALTGSDIPMPTDFGREVVELVYKYGQFRQFCTNYPLGTLQTKLPKLSTDPAFGVIAMSAAVTEKSPQVSYVTFNAFKNGGLIRLPSEIDADNWVSLGQFLARYIARQGAKWEDTVGFLGDGSGTYGSVSGVNVKAGALAKKLQISAGNSNPSTITIANLRAIRALIDPAALGTACYYMNPTMEAHLSSMNTTTFMPYQAFGPNGPTFEGFPIRWVGVYPIYETTTRLNQYQMAFGDLSYWYFGERLAWDIQTSRDVFFATDEIAIRALERFDIQLMADAAMSTLQLAAS